MNYVFVINDSITNSVFESQVLQPLMMLRQQNNKLNILLISFEKNAVEQNLIKKITDYQIVVIILKNRLFWGTLSLRSAISDVKKILKHFDSYELKARGPLAGYVCLKALGTKNCTKFTVQARGLLAEEYYYAHRNDSWLLKFIHRLRKNLYLSVENKVYSARLSIPFFIEAVSPALKDYLMSTFKTRSECISIATHDIPQPIDYELIKKWRAETRAFLNISTSSRVYCYNGSVKAWQCPEKVIHYFQEAYKKNNTALLLILSQNTGAFEKILSASSIEKELYRIIHVPHNEIYPLLAAADYGIIFREPHVINWISRPTKVLEYQAVGLSIIHNNTIEMLHDI